LSATSAIPLKLPPDITFAPRARTHELMTAQQRAPLAKTRDSQTETLRNVVGCTVQRVGT
jgi:hypothetical protein